LERNMVWRNRSSWRAAAVFLVAALACACAAAQELEVQFTGTVTSVAGVPGANVADTIVGSLVFDLSALLPTTQTNGSTFSLATLSTPSTDPAASGSTVTFSSGGSFSTGLAGFNHIAALDIYRNAATGANIYSMSSTDLELPPGLGGTSISLTVTDSLGAATGIFSTPPGDLSLLQAIDWFAAGATAGGNFAAGDGGAAFALTSLHVGPVAAVPEPATLPLLLGGLGCVGVVALRRRRGRGDARARK